MRRIVLLAIGLLPVLALSGYEGGDSEEGIEVSGKVTWQGESLGTGKILFTPGEDNSGPAAGSAIENGRYRISAENGPDRGTYQIVVTASGPPSKFKTFGSRRVGAKPLPEENLFFTFTRELVTNNGEAQLAFELPSPSSE